MSSLVKAHYILEPYLATCCGVSACYGCLKASITDQILKQKEEEKTVEEPEVKEEDKVPAEESAEADGENAEEKGEEDDSKPKAEIIDTTEKKEPQVEEPKKEEKD